MILAQEQAELDSLFEDFKNFIQMRAKSKLRDSTFETYVMHLKVLFLSHGLPMDNLTVEDISRTLKSRIKKLAPSTANSVIVVLRKFAEFRGLDVDSRELRRVFQFKRVLPTKRFQREDILMPEDIVRILDLTVSEDYRAFFAVLWDTGARVGEICGLNYEDVTKDEHGFILDIKHSKTTARRLRLITDIGLDYFAPHYEKIRGTGALFRKRNGSRITPRDAAPFLRNRRERIDKKLMPQLFRKSASSWWKSSGLLQDRDIRIRMGHKPWSKMFERYYELYFQEDYAAAELRALNGNHEPEPEPDPEKELLVTITKLTERIEQLEQEKESQEHGPTLQ
jgi:integrase